MMDIILVVIGIAMLVSGVYCIRKEGESFATAVWLIVLGAAIELAAIKSYIL